MKRIVLLLALGILMGLVLAWWLMQPKPERDRVSSTSISPQLLARAVEVVAIAENGKDYRAAIDGWTELLAAQPQDRDLLLNQAVTVLKWISDTNALLGSGSIRDQATIALYEKQLAEANIEADRVLQSLTKLPSGNEDQDNTRLLVECELLITRSRVVPEEEGVQLRKQAAEKLIAALNKRSDQPLLAAKLLKLSEELQIDWPEVVAPATEAAYQAWKAQPRNLLLLIRAGQGLLDAKDKRLLEVVEASIDIAKPLMSMIKESDLRIAQPEAVLDATRKAVESGDWSKPPRVRPWFNILAGTTAFVADGRLLNPDIMALLNTSFLERWRKRVTDLSELNTTIGKCDIKSEPLPNALVLSDAESAPLIAWYDYDVDRDFDLLAIHGTKLRITPRADKPAQPLDLELPFAPSGFLIADLWTVDNPQRPQIKADNSAGDAASEGNSHDTIQEIVLWNESRVVIVSPDVVNSKLNLISEIQGLSGLADVQRMIVAELDGDGDLDLIVSTAQGLRVIQNNGNRTFQDITQYTALPPAGWLPTSMVACDFDRDLDLDIVCSSNTAPYLALMENILHSQLRFRPLSDSHWAGQTEAGSLAVLELDGNASWDVALVGDKSVNVVLTRTTGPGQLTPTLRQSSPLTGTSAAAERLKIGDLNLDGHIDVCLAGPRGVRVYWNDGQRLSEKAETIFDQPSSGLDIQDVDGDGRLELLTTVKGIAHQLKAVPEGEVHYLGARVRGINDNVGGRINHFAIGSTLELWADGQYQARVVDSPLTHFGYRVAPGILRVIFNNGLTQNVLLPPPDSLVQERQELKGSCPFLYGWDGERFQMITDLLWNAPLGLQVARGQPLPDRRWENLLLPGKLVVPGSDSIQLRVTEELWEVAYFDHMQLTAIDHPSEVEVWTNEKVGPPSIAQHRLFTASKPVWPTAARDGYDRDVLAQLRQRDGQYVQAFQRQICQGLCEPHWIELTFDPAELGQRSDLRLVLTGWMHPTDTSLNIGISQNDQRQLPAPPSLWAPDASGQFVCKQPFMGFPGGKPKTIVVDLKDIFEGDDTRVRIESSQQIYWDQAYLTVDEPPVPIIEQEVALKSAVLQYRGFNRLLPRRSNQPHWYAYGSSFSVGPKWPPLEGLFTRYGDVLPQMKANDDFMVVMASGDEMVLEFAIPERPLPEGWTRDYVLHSVGWDKDADLNTLEGQSSLPLPFAGMHSYPPSLEDEERAQEVWKLNAGSLVPRDMFSKFKRRGATARVISH